MNPSKPPVIRFPFNFLMVLMGLLVILFIGVAYRTYDAYQMLQASRQLDFKLQELWGSILSLEKELSMAVHLAAATQNRMWEERYHTIKPKLDSAILEAIEFAPESKKELIAVDAAHLKAIEIEEFIFSLIGSGNAAEANVLLLSEEYKDQKAQYANGLALFIRSLKKKAEEVFSASQENALRLFFIASFSVVFLLLFWVLTLMRWKKSVTASNQALREQEAKLIETNQTLESEVSERKKLQAVLAEQAIHDPLTGLYNRRYFTQRCTEEITRVKRSGRPFAILLCDLDRFKLVNDTFGHPVGDEILKSVAKNLKEALREIDLVFRWGGDEFIVLLLDTPSGGLLGVADRIRKKVRSVNDGADVVIDLSIGTAFYPDHGNSLETLVQVADRALYFAKKTSSHFHIGDEEYKLDERSVTMVFQPIWDTRSDQILGYEALGRDATGKLSILELFKQYDAIGQLHELKSYCFKQQLKIAVERSVEKLFLNVDFNLLNYLKEVLKPSHMEVLLEISELESIEKIKENLAVVEAWRAQGYQFVIDDFGAGFVSFPFLAKLVPDYIKIDRSVMLQAVASKEFKEFLKHMVEGLRQYARAGIIVEGVETNEELKLIQSIGINLVQGYFLGRPKALPEWVGDRI
ncbi:MAG: diguanylate cyclase [Gammaproteobacteria bacterium]|nr:diguanylate cyclase [Gammaproteobacteria bacterium]